MPTGGEAAGAAAGWDTRLMAGSLATPPRSARPLPVRSGAGGAGLLALWTLAGLVSAVAALGILTVGVFVLPVGALLVVLAVRVTRREPGRWPAAAGLGIAAAVAVVWLGIVAGEASPSSGSCSSAPGGPVVCVDGQGRRFDPEAFAWGAAVPWFAGAALVAVASVATYLLARAALSRQVTPPGP